MSIEPVRLVAMQRLIRISATIEAELTNISSPLVQMLAMARDEAADAMSKLVEVPWDSPDQIRKLQNIIIRFDDLVGWLKALVAKGFEYDREINHSEREELADMLAYTPDGDNALDAEEAFEAGTMERGPYDA